MITLQSFLLSLLYLFFFSWTLYSLSLYFKVTTIEKKKVTVSKRVNLLLYLGYIPKRATLSKVFKYSSFFILLYSFVFILSLVVVYFGFGIEADSLLNNEDNLLEMSRLSFNSLSDNLYLIGEPLRMLSEMFNSLSYFSDTSGHEIFFSKIIFNLFLFTGVIYSLYKYFTYEKLTQKQRIIVNFFRYGSFFYLPYGLLLQPIYKLIKDQVVTKLMKVIIIVLMNLLVFSGIYGLSQLIEKGLYVYEKSQLSNTVEQDFIDLEVLGEKINNSKITISETDKQEFIVLDTIQQEELISKGKVYSDSTQNQMKDTLELFGISLHLINNSNWEIESILESSNNIGKFQSSILSKYIKFDSTVYQLNNKKYKREYDYKHQVSQLIDTTNNQVIINDLSTIGYGHSVSIVTYKKKVYFLLNHDYNSKSGLFFEILSDGSLQQELFTLYERETYLNRNSDLFKVTTLASLGCFDSEITTIDRPGDIPLVVSSQCESTKK